MADLRKLHDEVYALLMRYREENPSFYFTFRKSNRNNKLQEGYWFYGDEDHLAVSFWRGMDWKNKTPNIIFVIRPGTGESVLEVHTSDSEDKRTFVVRFLVPALGLENVGQRYQKVYNSSGDYLASLINFIESDKQTIDKVIQDEAPGFFSGSDQGIGFIEGVEFDDELEKINSYRILQKERTLIEDFIVQNKPHRLKYARIENFGPIQNIEITEIPFPTQWIFFTGENGTGKTSILRALATAICFRPTVAAERLGNDDFRINLGLFVEDGYDMRFERQGEQGTDRRELLTSGFAAYGQSRLRTALGYPGSGSFFGFSHESSYASLFNIDSPLIDLQQQLDRWRENTAVYDKRKAYITEILTDMLPNLYNINFDDRVGDQVVTTYIEKDHEGGAFRKVGFDQLASGLKSMIAMIGDIMVRLYEQQPDVFDPAEFTGIVLIDEIDIHLHPKLQKELVEQLTRTFPKIQFIASTHSPVSLLGAPKNSLIYRVERNVERGVMLFRLDDKLILGDLLPNTILTSPIFGMQDIIPNSHETGKAVRTETNYADVEFNDQVKRKINEFMTDEKEQQLIDLFKSRFQ